MATIKLPKGGSAARVHEIYAIVRADMDTWGLGGWTLALDRAPKRAGFCDHVNRTISLSAPLMSLWEVKQGRDTGLHEIAHAIVDPIHGHDATWRKACRKVGAAPSRLYNGATHAQVPLKYTGTCPSGHVTYCNRLPKRKGSCIKCSPIYNRRYLLKWTETR